MITRFAHILNDRLMRTRFGETTETEQEKSHPNNQAAIHLSDESSRIHAFTHGGKRVALGIMFVNLKLAVVATLEHFHVNEIKISEGH